MDEGLDEQREVRRLTLMRLPRSRRRWSDDDDEDACFEQLYFSDGCEDAAEPSAPARVQAGHQDGRARAGTRTSLEVKVRPEEAVERVSGMASGLEAASDASRRGDTAAAELWVQAISIGLTGADVATNVAAVPSGVQVVDSIAGRSYAGRVLPTEADARASAFAQAFCGLRASVASGIRRGITTLRSGTQDP